MNPLSEHGLLRRRYDAIVVGFTGSDEILAGDFERSSDG